MATFTNQATVIIGKPTLENLLNILKQTLSPLKIHPKATTTDTTKNDKSLKLEIVKIPK